MLGWQLVCSYPGHPNWFSTQPTDTAWEGTLAEGSRGKWCLHELQYPQCQYASYKC